MKGPDADRLRSEKKHSLARFVAIYNEGLPREYPRASSALLELYRRTYPSQFRPDDLWSLDKHRKKVMNWIPVHLKMTSLRRLDG